MTEDSKYLAVKIESLDNGLIEIKDSIRTMVVDLKKIGIIEERQLQIKYIMDKSFNDIDKQEKAIQELLQRISHLERGEQKTEIASGWVYDTVKWAAVLIGAVGARKLGLL